MTPKLVIGWDFKNMKPDQPSNCLGSIISEFSKVFVTV